MGALSNELAAKIKALLDTVSEAMHKQGGITCME